VFLTSIIDAKEGRDVATLDIPGAFMQSDMNEVLYLQLDGPMAELLVGMNPEKWKKYSVGENGKQVIYVRLLKAHYGTLQAALLFWENLSVFLVNKLGYTLNQYD
jgi:hypothetical protein